MRAADIFSVILGHQVDSLAHLCFITKSLLGQSRLSSHLGLDPFLLSDFYFSVEAVDHFPRRHDVQGSVKTMLATRVSRKVYIRSNIYQSK